MNWYNENDPKAAAWLRELIYWGQIPDGVVDDRSIEDVWPSDLAGFTQCHFFAGIGGWALALRLAGWPDDRPVWTGSCPCQPFSAAGKGAGFADERHLWPAWHWLIRQRRPDRIYGEQVATALQWWDLVSADLEAEGYACGAAIIGAHSVGAPHIRQRLYWLADRQNDGRREERPYSRGLAERNSAQGQPTGLESGGMLGGLGLTNGNGRPARIAAAESARHGRAAGPDGGARGMADTDDEGSQRRGERRDGADQRTAWPYSLVDCRDGKRRPVEPGTFPLSHGVPGRVGLLRGYGNAIVPQAAAAFIEACA